MDTDLWNKISDFDLDSPFSEYGFSTRLADENYWTRNFTTKAVLEYKKFMYLAGTSDFMVSPSEIIDTVWHQHLIYTQSYSDFCQVIGKNIQHIPSTHNKDDAEKFKQAKERTRRLYAEVFGEQPAEIWAYAGMYESLELEKAKWNLRSFILVGIFAFIVLLIPFYFLLRPIYINIENPIFIQSLIAIAVAVFVFLEIYNRKYLTKTVRDFHKFSFINDLTAQELIYLKTQNISNVVHGTVNKLVEENKIIVEDDHSMEKTSWGQAKHLEEFQIYEVCDLSGKTSYFNLLTTLVNKPVFANVANCMNAFKKYFIKSKRFGRLFYLNFVVLALLVAFTFIRLVTGILQDKPIEYIIIALIVLIFFSAFFLIRLTNMVNTTIIPTHYKKQIIPLRQTDNDSQWQFFLFGSTVLAATFIPTMQYADKKNSNFDGGGSSSASSCGSSCSSCGGCGGGD